MKTTHTPAWRDETSRSRNEDPRSEPRTWKFAAGPARIIVTRMHQVPGLWFLLCHDLGISSHRQLRATDIESAKTEALAIIRARVQKIALALAKAKETT